MSSFLSNNYTCKSSALEDDTEWLVIPLKYELLDSRITNSLFPIRGLRHETHERWTTGELERHSSSLFRPGMLVEIGGFRQRSLGRSWKVRDVRPRSAMSAAASPVSSGCSFHIHAVGVSNHFFLPHLWVLLRSYLQLAYLKSPAIQQ